MGKEVRPFSSGVPVTFTRPDPSSSQKDMVASKAKELAKGHTATQGAQEGLFYVISMLTACACATSEPLR